MNRGHERGGGTLDEAIGAVDETPPSEEEPRPSGVGPPRQAALPKVGTRGSAPMWGVFAALALAVVVVDQVTKALVAGALRPGQSTAILDDWVRIVYGQNSGALFGLFRDNATLFGAVSLAVVALIVVYHARSGRSVIVSIALGLLLGGAIGNVTDRFRLGYVVDFVDIGIGSWRWYTFNVADAAISAAILILLALAMVPGLAPRFERPSSHD